MTRIIRRTMYCKNCGKSYVVPVVASTNSYMLNQDKDLQKRAKEGNLFKNLCPVCKQELEELKDE